MGSLSSRETARPSPALARCFARPVRSIARLELGVGVVHGPERDAEAEEDGPTGHGTEGGLPVLHGSDVVHLGSVDVRGSLRGEKGGRGGEVSPSPAFLSCAHGVSEGAAKEGRAGGRGRGERASEREQVGMEDLRGLHRKLGGRSGSFC